FNGLSANFKKSLMYLIIFNRINPGKLINVQTKLEAFLAQEQELKERAQRCFVSYIRSVYLMKNKDVFDVFAMPLKEYAFSLGLAVAPRIRFLQKALKRSKVPCTGDVVQGTDTVAESLQEDVSDADEELEDFKAQFREHKPSSQMESREKTEDGKAVEGSVYDENQESSDDGNLSDQNAEVEKDEGTIPLQFWNDDGDDNDELDLLTVKRRNVFGFEAEEKTVSMVFFHIK
ncbi:probable ATP-dependent RNA helicase DDX10, partial [Rhincodon typus]|uniref:probable ATP-dependent RNA helicase DDX10 n=1 Tax=Rhincodon typus TaxID=259920 RepID=UPI00202E0845